VVSCFEGNEQTAKMENPMGRDLDKIEKVFYGDIYLIKFPLNPDQKYCSRNCLKNH